MKQRVRKGLALLLTFILAWAVGLLPVLPAAAMNGEDAQYTGIQKPEVIESTTDSIKLRTEPDCEYAIETVKDKTKAWSWADAGQYDKENRTVVFTGLQAGTTYRFSCRHMGEKVILFQNTASTNVAEEVIQKQQKDPQEATKIPPEPMQNQPEVNQNPEKKSDNLELPEVNESPEDEREELTKGTSDIVKDNDNSLTGEKQKPANNNEVSEDNTQTPADENQKTNNTKNAEPILKVPDSPIVKEVKDTEIILDLPENADKNYKYEYSYDGANYQAESKFDKLTPETEYKFYVRIAAGEYSGVAYSASKNSSPVVVKTIKAAPEKPKYLPEAAERTNTSISLKVSDKEAEPETLEFGMLNTGTDVLWNTTGVFDKLNPGTEYQFIVRRIVDEKVQMQGPSSDVLHVTTLNNAADAPSVPKILKRSDTLIVLKAVDNQEYAMIIEGAPIKWQDSTEFSGLKPNTEYQFITRIKFDPDKAMESIPSEPVKIRTAIGFDGAQITGIENGGSYEVETVWTATAVGVGMENTSPSEGDTRWVPKTWTWGGVIKNWDEPPYTVKFKCTKLGDYKLTVGYQLEEYTGDGWTAAEFTNTVSTAFNIIKKKVTTFTITAEAGTNGKINPDGSVYVEKGKDYEFTFTPNKGYTVAKVFVDGIEVKGANNRYTFTNIQDNHKISVTFEKDKHTPKTGDNIPFTIILGAFLISGMTVLMLAYRRRKR